MKLSTFVNILLASVLLTSMLLTSAITTTADYSTTNTQDYDPWMDLNDDGEINLYDAVMLLTRFGTEGTPINKTDLLLELLARVDVLELNQSLLAERIAVLEDEVERLKGTESTFFFDRFETGLNNWSYWGGSGYWLAWVSNTAKISGDGYPVDSGMQKVVDLSEWNESGSLLLSFDWRATSDVSGSHVTNAVLQIEDADSHAQLYNQWLVWGGIIDTGWQNYTNDISSHVLGHNRIRIILYLHDAWVDNHHQTNSYDNIKLTNATSP